MLSNSTTRVELLLCPPYPQYDTGALENRVRCPIGDEMDHWRKWEGEKPAMSCSISLGAMAIHTVVDCNGAAAFGLA
jgi:hypothetical protein